MRSICRIEGCERVVNARGLCSMHWKRWWRHGDPEKVERIIGDTVARFMSKVNKDGPVVREDLGPCWLWTAYVNASGYGLVGMGQAVKLAHRVAYELDRGEIPAGLEVDHLCRTRLCVRPSHLEAVTRLENNQRAGLQGLAADNAAKTHCLRGHPLYGENVRLSKTGQRICRICNREAQRRWREGRSGA